MAQQQKKKKSFSVHDFNNIKPKTYAQEEVFQYFSDYDVMSLLGAPGTGKSFISFYLAMREAVKETTPYERVIVIRSTVPSREIGFLPGEHWEKEEPYFQYLDDIANEVFKYKTNNVKNLRTIGLLECISSSFLRSMTFDDAIVICEECQNYNFQELNTIMTRIGVNSKVMFVGDMNQNDLCYNKRDRSGFNEFYQILQSMSSHVSVQFRTDDIVRSGIVRDYIEAGIELGYF